MENCDQRPIVALCVNSAWNVVNFRVGLVKSLTKAGYRVVVLAPPDRPADELAELGCELVPVAIDRGSLSPIHDLKLLLRLRRILRILKPVALLCYTIKANIYGSLAAQSLGIPVINNIAGLGTMFLRGRPAAQLAKLLYRTALARSRVVFFQNPDDRDLFMGSRLTRLDQSKLLPGSGIDLQRFVVTPLPTHGAGMPVVFVLIARLLRDKGVAEYIEAAEQLRNAGVHARLLLVGGYDQRNAASIASDLLYGGIASGAIDYRGAVEDVRPIIAEADCVVLPSYREGLPRTLLEGAAMGRPIIATDVPGCREVVHHDRNGVLCRVRDASSLAEAMRWIVGMDAGDRQKMGAASRALVEQRFDERLVVEAYLSVIGHAERARRD